MTDIEMQEIKALHELGDRQREMIAGMEGDVRIRCISGEGDVMEMGVFPASTIYWRLQIDAFLSDNNVLKFDTRDSGMFDDHIDWAVARYRKYRHDLDSARVRMMAILPQCVIDKSATPPVMTVPADF